MFILLPGSPDQERFQAHIRVMVSESFSLDRSTPEVNRDGLVDLPLMAGGLEILRDVLCLSVIRSYQSRGYQAVSLNTSGKSPAHSFVFRPLQGEMVRRNEGG